MTTSERTTVCPQTGRRLHPATASWHRHLLRLNAAGGAPRNPTLDLALTDDSLSLMLSAVLRFFGELLQKCILGVVANHVPVSSTDGSLSEGVLISAGV